jgi:murein DD-endopeptidase MepM/ murein hydrolase activator NlpD
MNRDDRLHAFIVAQTSRTRSQVRKISIHKRWLKIAAACFAALMLTAVYGIYSAIRRANELHVELENRRLRTDNEKQRDQLNELKSRIDALEDKSRRLAEATGVAHQDEANNSEARGAGGPSLPLDANAFKLIEQRAAHVEQELHKFERAMREKELARIPSTWPLAGKLTDGFGARHNPFGGGGYEFHPGQDIANEKGTPVVATADGVVTFADWQNGYGQLVVIDHQNGLFTRFGHLSQINVSAGQRIKRGDIIGLVGSTGRSTGPHLHYEVRVGDQAVNPLDYLPH